MKILRKTSVAIVLASAIVFSSCIGSFKLTSTVHQWNMNVSNSKFVNELVFLLALIIPAYQVAMLIDGLILNSIEFWSGTNPMAMKEGDKQEKLVEIEGKTYRLTAEKYKMTFEELNSNKKTTELVFSPEDNSWYLKKGKTLHKLIETEINERGEVISYHMVYPDGTTFTVNSGFDQIQLQNQVLAGQNLAFK